MIQYTDVPMTITVKNATFLTAREIIVSLRQRGKSCHISSGIRVLDDTHVSLTITQAQSGQFLPNKPCAVQVNFVAADGQRRATNTVAVPVMENLFDRVITDE